MGAMGCFRNGCERVMCDRRSSNHGYICDICFDELVDSGIATNIKEFMNSDKSNSVDRDIVEERFSREFHELNR